MNTPPLNTSDLNLPLSARFDSAFLYAHSLHARQVRKGAAVPYIAHLMAVAAIALEHGADEDEAIAALLHDAVEDQGGLDTRQQILDRFGQRVTDIVDGCTDAVTIPKPPWQERKESYLAHLTGADSSVLLVSASDKLHNVRSLLADYRECGETLWSRFQGAREGTLWYYRALATAYRASGQHPGLVEELSRCVSELENLASSDLVTSR